MDPLRTVAWVSDWSGISPAALAQMRYTGKGPRFVKLGGKSIRYRQSDLEAWVESSVRSRTDERSAPKAG